MARAAKLIGVAALVAFGLGTLFSFLAATKPKSPTEYAASVCAAAYESVSAAPQAVLSPQMLGAPGTEGEKDLLTAAADTAAKLMLQVAAAATSASAPVELRQKINTWKDDLESRAGKVTAFSTKLRSERPGYDPALTAALQAEITEGMAATDYSAISTSFSQEPRCASLHEAISQRFAPGA